MKVDIINGSYVGSDNRESLFDLSIPMQFNGQLIIFVHGFMGFKDWGAWHLVQEYFKEKGFAFCKFNLSHNGGTIQNGIDFPDEESIARNTYSYEVNDIKCISNQIIQYFETMPQFHLIGHSRGGGAALLAAKEIGPKTLSLWASISSIASRFPSNETLNKWEKDGIRYVENSRTKQALPQYFSLFQDFQENHKRLDIEIAARSLECAVSVFHGKQDKSVDLSEGELLANGMMLLKMILWC